MCAKKKSFVTVRCIYSSKPLSHGNCFLAQGRLQLCQSRLAIVAERQLAKLAGEVGELCRSSFLAK